MNKFQKYAAKLILRSSWDEINRAFLRGDDIPTVNGQIPVTTDTAMKYSAVFGCVRVLSETLASMPIMLYRKKPNGDREPVTDIAAYDILHNAPNEEMSPFSFKESCMMALNTGGYAVCERLIGRYGDLVGLNPLPWSAVRIDRDKTTNKLVYLVRDGVIERKLTRQQVFHIPGLSFDGINGLSPIEYAASAIRLGLSYEQFGNKFYQNGAHSSGVFSFPGELGEEAYARLKGDLTKAYTGLSNTGKPILLEGGGSFSPLTIKPVDAQMLESKNFQIEDICRIYRVPMHLVQNLQRATFSNIEHQSLEFVVYTMLPWAQRWEQAINSQLLSQQERRAGYYFELKMDSLLRGDIKSRYEAYATGIQWGILSINDCLKLENMNSVEGGDRRIQPLNMININKADEYYSKELSGTSEASAMASQLKTLIEGR